MLTAATVSACSPGGDPGRPSPPSSTSSVPSYVVIPTEVANNVDHRKRIVVTSCKPRKDGGWEAQGTAANPDQNAIKYTITMFFTTAEATVLDYTSTSVEVPAGSTGNWTAHKDFKAPLNVNCVLRGVS